MSDRVKVGVIGVGRMGQLHLNKLLASPRAEVVGVLDTDAKRLGDVAKAVNVRPYTKLVELLFDCDAVVVATTTSAHYAVARAALESGVHVLVEKPIAPSPEEAEELVRLAEAKGLILQVGLIERFRLSELRRDVRLSPVRFVESHRLSPALGREKEVDVVMDLMIHDLDLTLSLVGEDPSAISAVGVNVLTPYCDLANVRLEFPGGAVANLTASRVSAKQLRKFRVFSADSYASFDLGENHVELFRREKDGVIERASLAQPDLDALRAQAEGFLSSVAGEGPPAVSGRDALRALRCAHEIRSKILSRPPLTAKEGECLSSSSW